MIENNQNFQSGNLNQIVQPKNSNNKKILLLSLLSIVLLVTLLVYFSDIKIMSFFSKTNKESVSDLKVYVHEGLGFQFKYQKDLPIKEEEKQANYSKILIGGNILHINAGNGLISEKNACGNSYEKRGVFFVGNQKMDWCLNNERPDNKWSTFVNGKDVWVMFDCWYPETNKNVDFCQKIISTFEFVK